MAVVALPPLVPSVLNVLHIMLLRVFVVVVQSDGEDHDFTGTDAGASNTYPVRAGEVKKGSFVVIKEHPCKVGQGQGVWVWVCLFFSGDNTCAYCSGR